MALPINSLSIQALTHTFDQVLQHDQNGQHPYLIRENGDMIRVCRPTEQGYDDLNKRIPLLAIHGFVQDLAYSMSSDEVSKFSELKGRFQKIIDRKDAKIISLTRKLCDLNVKKSFLYRTVIGTPFASLLDSYLRLQLEDLPWHVEEVEICRTVSLSLNSFSKEVIQNIVHYLIPQQGDPDYPKADNATSQSRLTTLRCKNLQKIFMASKCMRDFVIISKAALVKATR